MIDLIGIDADDTLWRNEHLYIEGRECLGEILRPYGVDEDLQPLTDSTEFRNLELYGYGIMSFVLSLVESAIRLTGGEFEADDVQKVLDMGKEMLGADVELKPHAGAVVEQLANSHSLVLITKGELHNQLRKALDSGLRKHFESIDVVPEKDRSIYKGLLEQYGVESTRFLMIGNSMKSDILPVLDLGGWAIYVPHETTWSHEHADPPPESHQRYFEVEHLGLVPALIAELEAGGG